MAYDNAEAATYLGQKGYAIYKECISVQEQQYIREKLTVKPQEIGRAHV